MTLHLDIAQPDDERCTASCSQLELSRVRRISWHCTGNLARQTTLPEATCNTAAVTEPIRSSARSCLASRTRSFGTLLHKKYERDILSPFCVEEDCYNSVCYLTSSQKDTVSLSPKFRDGISNLSKNVSLKHMKHVETNTTCNMLDLDVLC